MKNAKFKTKSNLWSVYNCIITSTIEKVVFGTKGSVLILGVLK